MRIIVLSAFAAVLFAAGAVTPFSQIAELAHALSASDARGALEVFDSKSSGYGEIAANVRAITAQNEVLCAIDVVEEKDNVFDTDWYLQLKSKSNESNVERRRERVKITMSQIAGKWKIVDLTPVSILAPLQIR